MYILYFYDEFIFYGFREYLVDLVGKPGCLCEPDSILNGPSSISICSPLRFPQFRSVEPAIDFSSLAKQYFSDCQSLTLVFDRPSTGTFFCSHVVLGISRYAHYMNYLCRRESRIRKTRIQDISRGH